MKGTTIKVLLAIVSMSLVSCSGNNKSEVEKVGNLAVATTQIGFRPQDEKAAMVRNLPENERDSFYVVDLNSGDTVASNILSKNRYWEASGEYVSWALFTDLKEEGRYEVRVRDAKSHPFEIKKDSLYHDLSLWAHKTFYLWRCGMDIDSVYAEFKGNNYARRGGHPDTMVKVHESAINGNLKAGDYVSSPGGWYDAGDYGKYTVNAAISLAPLLSGYEAFKDYYKKLNLNIPESGNKTPDILDECMYELEWLLTMQDQTDGSVAHKLTTLKFAGFVMPDDSAAKEQRYIIGRATEDALSFAAVMAQASRIYKGNKDYPKFSDRALKAAEKAWKWALDNPNELFVNPEDVNTGWYAIPKINNRWFWAATELYLTTKKDEYLSHIELDRHLVKRFKYDRHLPCWQNAKGYAYTSLVIAMGEKRAGKVDTTLVKSIYKSIADKIADDTDKSAGVLCIDNSMKWGSNGMLANAGMIEVIASKYIKSKSKKRTKPNRYLDVANQCVNYLTGCNSVDYCFVTGFGSNSPKNIHDRRSAADGIDEPIPGLLVGGCNNEQTNDYEFCVKRYGKNNKCKTYPSTKFPARCYVDEDYSFSTNEVAINWNAPFATLMAGVIALGEK